MEKQIIFRDYQEQQASDHNDLQSFARESFDALVTDAVSGSNRYAGFTVTKTSQAEVNVAAGRFYQQGGAIYALASAQTNSLVAFLPVSSRRIVSVSVYGVENEIDIETRDFLTNVDTGQVEPQAIAMVRSRDAVVVLRQGAENPDPQPPAIPSTEVEIARVLLDTTQVVSITMMVENQVESTEALDERAGLLEAWKALIGPRLDSLASDLAALAAKINRLGQQTDIVKLYQDLAEVKEKVGLPQQYSQYGADYFLWADSTKSDINNVLLLGYDADVEMGIRFPAANATEFEIKLFSQNDQNAMVNSGLLLPAYDSVLKIATGDYFTDLGIAQYGFQTYQLVEQQIKKERLRYGGQYAVCSNGATQWTQAATGDAPYWLPNFETYETVDEHTVYDNPWHSWTYTDYWWHDTWTEPYWELQTVDHTINGAQVAQSFLVANDVWATKLGFYITAKAAAEDIWVTLCKVTNGVPDLEKVISHVSYPQQNIVVGWNELPIVPTFMEKGSRYAVVLTSAANHRLGMSSGQQYLEGTFFYSTDGAYFLGDLTKDLMLRVYGAKFRQTQCTIEFGVINLDGGLRNIDITAGTIVPGSTQLIYEMRPNGAGDWQQLTIANLNVLTGAPPLCQFRARFVGTSDAQAGLQLTGSRVFVSRPKTAFKHITTAEVLGTASNNITVKLLLERFNPTPHTIACKLRVAGADVNPTTSTTTLVNADAERYELVYNFVLAAPTATFNIITSGTTNSPATLFHVAERVFWAI